MRRLACVWLALGAFACGPSEQHGVLGTVALGDNFVAPDLTLDEDFFYCRIQPEVLTKHSCASGQSGDGGNCHGNTSALRLIDTDDAPPCDSADRVRGSVPDAYAMNFDAVQFFVQSDALTSPLYLRPVGLSSHPRRIFDEEDPAARLLLQWISAGAR
jgi:hypothetical protein